MSASEHDRAKVTETAMADEQFQEMIAKWAAKAGAPINDVLRAAQYLIHYRYRLIEECATAIEASGKERMHSGFYAAVVRKLGDEE